MSIEDYLLEAKSVLDRLLVSEIHKLAQELRDLREHGGKLFVIGLGGSAANASHAVNDFRKLCNIEAYCPTDNVAEFTAWANDVSWKQAFNLGTAKPNDGLLVLSVGGGTEEVSRPISYALLDAKSREMRILGIVGRDGGRTYEYGHAVVIVPTVNPKTVTFHTESMQSVILHALVQELQENPTRW